MKNLYSFLASVLLVLALPLQSNAQIWDDLGIVFEQLDTNEQGIFLDQLDDFPQGWSIDSVNLNGILDSLYTGLDMFDTGSPVDSMLNAWNAGSDSLSLILENSNLDAIDSLAITQEYDQTNDIWNLNLDSLGSVLQDYGGGPDFPADSLDNGVMQFEAFGGLGTQILNDLQQTFAFELENAEPLGVGNMPGFLDTLLSSMFDLELAFGQQTASVNFWGERYDTKAMEIRVGSVPRFDKVFEARWHVQASYFTDDNLSFDETTTLQDGLNALRYDGNFSLMANPKIGSIGSGDLRLYTSFGIEVGSYVPPHVDPSRSETFDRVGRTTGWGPQAGAGFVVSTGNINIYAYGTFAQGRVFNSPDYDYLSSGVRAGIRYGDVVNISYQFTRSSWAPNEAKYLDGYGVSVGLILSELMN